MARFLRGAWYVAAWAEEVTRALLPRTLLDEPVLLFRKQDGSVAVLADSCPHRFAPLHMGKLIGDTVECGYHGLCFDAAGHCVANPHGNHVVPSRANVRAYPVIERHSLVWIWMGEAERADPELVPDLAYLTASGRRTVTGGMTMAAHYEILTDNLMDPSHARFLHSKYLDNDGDVTLKTTQEGGTVYARQWLPDRKAPGFFAGCLPDDPEKVDMWIEFIWQAPALLHNSTGVTCVGEPRSEGIEQIGTHLLTPETELSTHYFYANSRSFRLDDASMDDRVRQWFHDAFVLEDKVMAEAIQRRMKNATDLLKMDPVLLSIDAASVRVRRHLAGLIEAEMALPAQASPL
ncbi:aromatic ring-hydroxylating dioxygenase subunit alpha [Sphingobium sp. EM0848]|uniref:aromatic ring-hydroxylating dioxygenase subunit alpha n=1 Tax=Sphingobium sp. EM0848 TaxID=2743473 RepID=UPI00159C5F0F|nr:aromatic ring-hydroxylating dioxygenase subunit alpha [Sphingobium sp. EM0848]